MNFRVNNSPHLQAGNPYAKFMTKRATYEIEAERIAKAIDLAVEAFKKYPPKDFTEAHVSHFVNI